MRYLTSGLAQAHPCVARYSTPVSYGPEVRYRIPSALCVNYKAMASNRTYTLMAEAGVGIVLPGPYEAGSRG